MAIERKRPTRSSKYQHLLVEKAFNHEMMESFPIDDSLYKKLNPFDYDERILVLEDQLKERFWEIIEDNLTRRQLEIVKLLKEGKTQEETAKILKVNQCLASDTLIFNGSEKTPISNIYNLWDNDSSKTKQMSLISINEATKEIINTFIVAIIKNNPKQLLKITTKSGLEIRSSEDHKFFTDLGWRRLKDIIRLKLSVSIYNNKSIIFDQINQVKYDGIEETYDIEVNDPWHNFIANGFVVSNSSITKSINGNTSYGVGTKTSYGGICKKLAKIVDGDSIIKNILQQISDLRNNGWI